jgi:hypothetical protein
MATLFVDKIDPQSGTTLEIGSSGDTLNLGATAGGTLTNRPAFQASLSTGASQVIPSQTQTKGIFSNEHFDTDNAYDTSNGRFTVPTGKGGVYHVMSNIFIDDIDNLINVAVRLNKNGVGTTNPNVQGQMYGSGGAQNWFVNFSMTITLAESDYIESYVYQGTTTNQNLRNSSTFGAYRLIGV